MQYKVSDNSKNKLLSLPETGMGYQIISKEKYQKKILVINSTIAFDIDDEGQFFEYHTKGELDIEVDLSHIIVDKRIGAIDAKGQMANGSIAQQFFRLSAFENDLGYDAENKCLRPGSFTTDLNDYWTLKVRLSSNQRYQNMGFDNKDINPIERYVLPTTLPINFVFVFKSHPGDTFQQGTVQPSFGKKGGEIECFFKNGTPKNTFHQMIKDEELKASSQ